MKRILVPCDFSEPSQEAFKFAVSIASVTKGEICVLNALDLPMVSESALGIPQYAYSPELLADLKAERNKNFELLRKSCNSTSPISFVCQQGPVRLVIQEYLKVQNIDLVVMGTHGSRGWEEFFIGSNTEKIVRISPVPVFAMRKAVAISQIRNIVLPTKMELNQTDFMDRVTTLQKFFHATLHILFVNTPENFKRDGEAKAALQEFANQYKLADYTMNVRNDPFEEDGILHFAGEIKADMIAMSTHSRRGLAHLFTGSIAEDVLNHSIYPLWTCTLKKK